MPEASGTPESAGGSAASGRLEESVPAREDVLVVVPEVSIPLRELRWRFSASGGPGGQHVNTANTRAEVSLDVEASPSIPGWARQRLLERLGRVVTVSASDRRSQARNRALALARLRARLADALEEAAPRRPTRPTAASQRRRVEDKRRQGLRKRERRGGPDGFD
jgi:ribosome-associated protein